MYDWILTNPFLIPGRDAAAADNQYSIHDIMQTRTKNRYSVLIEREVLTKMIVAGKWEQQRRN